MPPSPSELATRRTELTAAVAGHKAAIRRHRQELGAAKAALVNLELTALGIEPRHLTAKKELLHGRPETGV